MQGFNMGRYHPPSTLDPSLTTNNSTHTTRTRKLPKNLTVRFEMPFAIWCTTCPSHTPNNLIGQGVRFNAQKTRVGNYFSTPIWSFRMKHTACGGWIEIRTDPKNSEYVVTEGAKRRDYGEAAIVAERVGGVVLNSGPGDGAKEEEEKKRQDAFMTLEGKKEEKVRVKSETMRVEELRSLRERDWADVDERNRRLRAGFRVGRKERERDEKVGGALLDKMSLGIELVPEVEEDGMRARLEFLRAADRVVGDGAAVARPIFGVNEGKGKGKGEATSIAVSLHQALSSNTRASVDPFAITNSSPPTSMKNILPGVKRRKVEVGGGAVADDDHSTKSTTTLALVDYDSD